MEFPIFKQLFKTTKRSESLVIAMLMAFIGGFLDIYTYLARGKVFANTQTGNLVLLGYNMAERNTDKVIYYTLPILSFMIGVGLAEYIEHKWENVKGIRWMHIVVTIEVIVLLSVMFIPNGKYNVLANVIVSFICGLQAQTFRKVNGSSYSSTMFTGNLKNAAERLSNYTITKEAKALHSGVMYCFVIVMFILGAYVGDLVTTRVQEKAVGFVTIILVVVFILLYFDRETVEENQ